MFSLLGEGLKLSTLSIRVESLTSSKLGKYKCFFENNKRKKAVRKTQVQRKWNFRLIITKWTQELHL